jgi:hypothetical protein
MDEEGYPVDQEDMQDDQGGEVEDDPVDGSCFVLNQHTELDFYCASSLTQQSASRRHVMSLHSGTLIYQEEAKKKRDDEIINILQSS